LLLPAQTYHKFLQSKCYYGRTWANRVTSSIELDKTKHFQRYMGAYKNL
jgi:hypothetical protein